MTLNRAAPDPGELRDLCRRVLTDRNPRWEELIELGWAAILIPEDNGGMGWGWREAAIVAQELGRALTAVPFLSTALLAAAGLSTVLSAVAPAATAAVAGLPSQRRYDEPVMMAAGRLDGTCSFVLDAAGAERLLVVGQRDGTSVIAFADDHDGVDVRPHELVDSSRSGASVRFHGAAATVVAEGEDADRAVAAMETALLLGLACDSLGGAEFVFEQTVEYARNRVQFGRPIGSFQAIKHRLADLYVLLQGTMAIVEAAVADGTTQSLAHAYAADAYARIAGDAILVHGAIGFTWEHNLHRYLKRAMLNQHLAGPIRGHRDRHLDRRLAAIGGTL